MGREAFKTTSGLLDDYDFWVESSWFAKDKRFGGGADPILHLRGQALIDDEVVNEEETLLFGCGQGWEITNGGQGVTHPSGKTNFTDASNIGKLLNALNDLGDEPLDTMATKGGPTDAEVFLGVGLHMERKPFSFKDKKTGETNTYEVPLPTAFLGFADTDEEATPAPAKKAAPGAAKKAATPAAKKAAAPAKKAAAPAAPTKKAAGEVKKGAAKPAPEPEPEESDLRADVVEYAKLYTADEHAAFVDAVYDAEYFPRADDLQLDEELAAEVLDPDSALWAEAHEE